MSPRLAPACAALLALVAALPPPLRAAPPTVAAWGSEAKWEILTAVRYVRSRVPDACLSRAEWIAFPDRTEMHAHFWSQEKGAHYRTSLSDKSELPTALEQGDSVSSPVCIRDIQTGAEKALQTAFKHGLPRTVAMSYDLELARVEEASMEDEQAIYARVPAARDRTVWLISERGYGIKTNAHTWIIDAVSGKFVAHGF